MHQGQKRKNLSEAERNSLAQWLLQHSKDSKLFHGAKKKAACLFNVDLSTVWRIWKKATSQQQLGRPIHIVSMKKGCQHSDKKHIDAEKVKSLPLLERTSIRKIALAVGVNKWQVQCWLKTQDLRAHTSSIKPFLTPANMLTRMQFSLNQLSCISDEGMMLFQSMYNVIHIDEKWFNLTRETSRFYILKGETEPHRTCKSKSFIDKIMFECMVSRPIIDNNSEVLFDGKLGIIPFTYEEPAKRNSKNRQKGTMVTKPIEKITRAVMKQVWLQEMIPMIKAKWPEGISKNIIVQQDNARPHIDNNDPDFRAAASSDGFNIQLVQQPPNSPDTNINDLGFFRAIQTLKDEKDARTVDDMIRNVRAAFANFPAWKLNNAFLTLQDCHQEIIKCRGNNTYKIPHINKERLLRLGILPENISVDENIVREGWEYMKMQGVEGGTIFHNEDIIAGVEHIDLTD